MKLAAGIVLIGIGLLMVVGFFNADRGLTAASVGALLIGGVLPLATGGGLVYSHLQAGRRVSRSKDALRNQTLIAELLKFAERKGGRLTVVEVAGEFAVSPEQATELLNQLHAQHLASIEITDAGLIVYRFGDVQRLADKEKSRDLLNG